jgi:hypothetical protein
VKPERVKAPASDLYVMAYRALGWDVELVRKPDPDLSRMNGTGLTEKLRVAYLLEEAKLKGEHPRKYVREQMHYTEPTAGRKVKAARELLKREPEWQPQLEAIARERLSA